METEDSQLKSYESERKNIFIVYITLTTILLLVFISSYIYKFNEILKLYPNIKPRLIWCILFGMIGLTARIWNHLKHPETPFPPYILTFPILVFASSCFVFSIFHIFKYTNNYLFYTITPIFSFIFGYVPQETLKLINNIADKLVKKT